MSNIKALVRTVLQIIEVRAGGTLESLSEAEADLLAAVTAVGIIANGGLCYWHEGKSDEDTLRVVEAFDRMGLVEAAEAVRRSRQAFPEGALSRTWQENQRFVSANRPRLREQFLPLDEVLWALDIDMAAAQYIDARRAELRAASRELARVLRAS